MSNLNNILAALGDELNGLAQTAQPDAKEIARKIPFRSLTGDHIKGGTVQNFASTGIKDSATAAQLTIDDQGVHAKTLTVENIENLTVSNTLKTKVLIVDELRADIKFEKDIPITFSGDSIEGKGLFSRNPFVNLDVAGFSSLMRLFHFEAVSRKTKHLIEFEEKKGALDCITFTHLVDNRKTTLFNFCEY